MAKKSTHNTDDVYFQIQTMCKEGNVIIGYHRNNIFIQQLIERLYIWNDSFNKDTEFSVYAYRNNIEIDLNDIFPGDIVKSYEHHCNLKVLCEMNTHMQKIRKCEHCKIVQKEVVVIIDLV
jgi:hypothetical protein